MAVTTDVSAALLLCRAEFSIFLFFPTALPFIVLVNFPGQ